MAEIIRRYFMWPPTAHAQLSGSLVPRASSSSESSLSRRASSGFGRTSGPGEGTRPRNSDKSSCGLAIGKNWGIKAQRAQKLVFPLCVVSIWWSWLLLILKQFSRKLLDLTSIMYLQYLYSLILIIYTFILSSAIWPRMRYVLCKSTWMLNYLI